MLELLIILGSTRQNRQGEKVAKWVVKKAQQSTAFSATFVDLRDWPLPFFNEPLSPGVAKGNYQNELGRQWCQKVASGDAYLIVTPEYNHGYPAVLKNALDWSYYEWNQKPVGFVSYSGGPGSGIRAVEQLRQVVVELQMTPIRLDVAIPKVQQAFNDSGEPEDEGLNKRLDAVLTQLQWWAQALNEARKS